ncbi:hypothetical protein LJQ72_09340 [Pectobacterium brasiliense]|uniref:hypothetical protein n=1 Tax=Pectobacterium brasiliense TaxID=180957 RepID=UPI001D0CE6B7|nr:hypothetical protein [Pectobacterium brasiliense]UDQ77731.1 hypothetical protein LJQ72_09340 [Pectobacterium brasiliense]
MDKLLTKARHGLLIVSFLGIVFSLTGASFTGQSAIASYLGLKFSDASGFKWVYFFILIYTSIRYLVHYSSEFSELMAESIGRSIDWPCLNFFLKKILLDSSDQSDNGYYSMFGTWDDPNKNSSKLINLCALRYHDAYSYSSFNVNLYFSGASFRRLCNVEFEPSLLVSDFNKIKYLKIYHPTGNKGYLKRFSFVGIGVLFTGSILFLFDSFTRFRHFEYSIPLFTAFFALLMTINHFFFSEKILTISTTIRDAII